MTTHDTEINKNKTFFLWKKHNRRTNIKNPPPHLNQTLSSMDAKGELKLKKNNYTNTSLKPQGIWEGHRRLG